MPIPLKINEKFIYAVFQGAQRMKFQTVRILNGANVYSHKPVAVMRLALEDLKGKKSRDAADFNRRLLEALPDLKKHHCNRGQTAWDGHG